MKVKEIIEASENASGFSGTGTYSFICPGCGHEHNIPTKAPLYNGAIWGFNGEVDNPTFTPSINVASGHYVSGQPQPPDCWHCNDGHSSCYRCHFFIRNGRIEFCGDSTHPLRGQTVELVDIQ